MKKQFTEIRLWAVVLICSIFLMTASGLSAYGGMQSGNVNNGVVRSGSAHGERVHSEGVHSENTNSGNWHNVVRHRWSRPYWIGGMPYYYPYYFGDYYGLISDGFLIAPPDVYLYPPLAGPMVLYPVSATSQISEGSDNVTINIPDSHGGFTPVILKKYKDGYMGPQCEYYEGNPTVAQLRALYGK